LLTKAIYYRVTIAKISTAGQDIHLQFLFFMLLSISRHFRKITHFGDVTVVKTGDYNLG